MKSAIRLFAGTAPPVKQPRIARLLDRPMVLLTEATDHFGHPSSYLQQYQEAFLQLPVPSAHSRCFDCFGVEPRSVISVGSARLQVAVRTPCPYSHDICPRMSTAF